MKEQEMGAWKPIATAPTHRPIRLRKFPMPAGVKIKEWVAVMTIPGDEAVRIGAIDATHWMEAGNEDVWNAWAGVET